LRSPVGTLAQISTLLVGGVVADRLPRRLVMVSSEAANFLVRATMGALLISGHARIWEIFVLQAIGGAATAFYSPASSGLVPEIVPAQDLQKANALMGIARYISFPLGAAVGGSIVATIGSGAALLVDAATYAVSAALLSQIRLGARAARVATQSFVRELREGWQAFTEQTWIWLLTVWIALYFLVTYAPFFVLGPYIAKHSLGGAGAWAIVVTGEGIGALEARCSACAFSHGIRGGSLHRSSRSPRCRACRSQRTRRSRRSARLRSSRDSRFRTARWSTRRGSSRPCPARSSAA
jgi:hypothetical protein